MVMITFVTLLLNVLAVNLLIAMMNQRYQKITYVEWYFHHVQSVYYYSKAPLFPPPLNLLTFIPMLVARVIQRRFYEEQKQHGFDIFDRVDAAYARDSTNKHTLAQRTRNRVVSKYFNEHTRRELDDIKNRDQEAERLESNKGSRFDLLVARGEIDHFSKHLEKMATHMSGIKEENMDEVTRRKLDEMKDMQNEVMKLVTQMSYKLKAERTMTVT